MGYPSEFLDHVKSVYPDFPDLHQAVETEQPVMDVLKQLFQAHTSYLDSAVLQGEGVSIQERRRIVIATLEKESEYLRTVHWLLRINEMIEPSRDAFINWMNRMASA